MKWDARAYRLGGFLVVICVVMLMSYLKCDFSLMSNMKLSDINVSDINGPDKINAVGGNADGEQSLQNAQDEGIRLEQNMGLEPPIEAGKSSLNSIVANDIQDEQSVSGSGDSLVKRDKPKAAMLLIVTSIQEGQAALSTITSYQSRFNDKFQYDWIIMSLNNIIQNYKNPISQVVTNVRFIDFRAQSFLHIVSKSGLKMTGDQVEVYPKKFRTRGLSRSKHVTRFLLGELFNMEKLWDHYKYYWRVPVGSMLEGDVDEDVFQVMQDHNLQYGWLLMHKDVQGVQPEIMDKIQEFYDNQQMGQKGQNSHLDYWRYEDCSFNPDFEIVNTDFFRSKGYRSFYEFVDSNDLVYYRGWREPILKTVATSLFLNANQIKYFDDIPVVYPDYGLLNCPVNPMVYVKHRCSCDPYLKDVQFQLSKGTRNYELMYESTCVSKWLQRYGHPTPFSFEKEPQFSDLF